MPAIRERMVSSLVNVSAELAATVAAGLGIPVPPAMPKVLAQPAGALRAAAPARPAECSTAQTPGIGGAMLGLHRCFGESFMKGIPATGASVHRGLLGVLRSWWLDRSSEFRPAAVGAPIEASRPDAPPNASVRVLVVDDNPVNLMLVSAMLESRGVVPKLAADGAEAVALAAEQEFDLILMDLQMPVLDGLAATSAIRRHEGTCARPAAPVVAYSSLAPAVGILARKGMNGSLNKPCTDQELDDCLLRWCPAYRAAGTWRGADAARLRLPASEREPVAPRRSAF